MLTACDRYVCVFCATKAEAYNSLEKKQIQFAYFIIQFVYFARVFDIWYTTARQLT